MGTFLCSLFAALSQSAIRFKSLNQSSCEPGNTITSISEVRKLKQTDLAQIICPPQKKKKTTLTDLIQTQVCLDVELLSLLVLASAAGSRTEGQVLNEWAWVTSILNICTWLACQGAAFKYLQDTAEYIRSEFHIRLKL